MILRLYKQIKSPPLLVLVFLFLNALKIAIFYYLIDTEIPLIVTRHFLESFLLLFMSSLIILRFRHSVLFIVLYLAQLLLLSVNFTYYSSFDEFIRLNYYYTLLPESLELLKHFAVPLNPLIIFFFIDFPSAAAIAIKYEGVRMWIIEAGGHFRPVAAVIVVLVLSFYLWEFKVLQSDIDYGYHSELSLIQYHGFVFRHTADIKSLFGASKRDADKIIYGRDMLSQASGPEQYNILMIQVESLDANIVDATYNGDYITPFLHDLSRKSVYYPYCLSYRRGGGTSDAEVSILNSIEPLADRSINKLDTYMYPNSLVKRLTKGPYQALAFHGNDVFFYNRRSAYRRMGFDRLYGILQMNLKAEGWGASDKEVFAYVLKHLKYQKEPFLYYIITMTSHEPFRYVDLYDRNTQYNNVRPAQVRDYFKSLSYVDTTLKNFIEAFQRKYPRSYIYIFGDHTPYVIAGDEYLRSHLNLDDGRGFDFVPLLILTPDGKVHHERSKVAGFLDIAPTVLSSAGSALSIRTEGVNLLNIPLVPDSIVYEKSWYSREELYSRADKIPKYHKSVWTPFD